MKLKDLASFFLFFLRNLYMKSASYQQRNKSARTVAQFVPIGMPTVSWKNTSSKDNKYVVDQKLEHVDDISFFVGTDVIVFIHNVIIIMHLTFHWLENFHYRRQFVDADNITKYQWNQSVVKSMKASQNHRKFKLSVWNTSNICYRTKKLITVWCLFQLPLQ